MPISDPLPEKCDVRIRQLFDYWRSLVRTPGVLPGRAEFDPAQVPKLLPYLWMLDVHRAPLRFRYRLVGTAHTTATGRDYTGQWMDEAHPARRLQESPLYPELHAVVEEGRAAFRSGPPTIHLDRDYIRLETLLLPLAADGKTVDVVLGITVYLLPTREPRKDG